MVRVVVSSRIENLKDAWEVERGLRSPNDARSVVIDDALVETGATSLSLPVSVIRELGLNKERNQNVRTSSGVRTAGV